MYKLVNIKGQLAHIQKQVGDILVCIPPDPDNTDYQAYLAWLEEGNTPEPAETTE